ncbi:MAG TPA: sensor domain-containing diguanylate cyclase [Longimicrobium sp.]|jgi:diguanylate cyclase (GGDEF)-like protein|uniref:GGDEF domain-containing protein n=1 Tax=Longimicrobium sp. TaxID=2029185 RepID=UPI002ED8DA19
MPVRLEAPLRPRLVEEGRSAAVDPAAAVLAFASIPLAESPDATAAACVDAVRALTHGPVRLLVPTRPVPLAVGDPADGLVPVLRFPAGGGEGELLASPEAAATSPRLLSQISQQLARVWAVQQARAEQTLELDQLRFHLGALQQVARTLAVVRGADETVRLVLDSVGEVFFAWWAALYHTDGEQYTCRAVRSLRGESVAFAIPARVVNVITGPGRPPVIPPEDAEIRDHVPAEVAVVAPLDFGDGGAGLLILGRRMTEAPYEAHDLALLRALADSSAIALRNAELLDRLRAQATIDPLTGCHNRRGFDEILEREMSRAQRYGRPLSLVLLDIDRFKSINDDFGHEVGDHALQRIGRAVRHAFRSTDSACRYGGEEFALIFPETARDEATRLAEKMRVLVEQLPPTAEVPRALTASFGVAAFPDDAATIPDLIRAADRALYQAKTRGRNRVETA